MTNWKDKPTETGYWWFLGNEKFSRPEIVWYAATGDSIFHCGDEESVELDREESGKWLGPITPPDERFRVDCHFIDDPILMGTLDLHGNQRRTATTRSAILL